jgi:hypothetical protein
MTKTESPIVTLKARLVRLVNQFQDLARRVESLGWKIRWKWRGRNWPLEPRDVKVFPMDRLKVVVISLPSREDRRANFNKAMKNFGHTTFEYIDAIDGRMTFPNLVPHKAATKGCSESHRLGLGKFSPEDFDAVMMCEDDIEFLRPKNEVEKTVEEFMSDERLDVLCLSARVRGSRIAISDQLSIATRIVTGACYVVKPSAIAKLERNFRESSRRVSQGRRKAALDQNWHKLQRGQLFFAVPNTKTVKIVAGYSDIQGKFLPDVF